MPTFTTWRAYVNKYLLETHGPANDSRAGRENGTRIAKFGKNLD